ncbi:MAG: TIGR00282 family metallophosphoesterase [Puniceicoccales bacterium]|jgi:metallophosphoesterase (TIGR00282 family)|nr:TIGR00282 family metallophosphoesterase [Puniceicoccales bacterium]
MSYLLKILYLGDLVGRPARECIVKNLSGIKKIYDIDVIIANAENATSGAGLTREHAEVLHCAGIDLITLGDHVWDRHGFERDIEDLEYVCRPANLSMGCPGRSFITSIKNGIKIGVCIFLGQQFMKIHASCPFEAMERILQNNGGDVDILLAEIHAEATSEKIAFGWNFDGKVTGIVGTHTHVQTSDERILPNGTAYITDLGMCGPHESVIGREILPVLHNMKFGMPQKFEVASNDIRLNGVILTIDSHSRLATKIVRFSERMS